MISHARENASSSPAAKKHHSTAARKLLPRPPKSQRLHNFTLPVLKWGSTRTVRSDRPDSDFTLRSFPTQCPSTDLRRPLPPPEEFDVSPSAYDDPAVREIEAIREKLLALRSSASKLDFRAPVEPPADSAGDRRASVCGGEEPSSAAGPGSLRERRAGVRPLDDSRRRDSPPPALENSAKPSRRRNAEAERSGWRRPFTLALKREEIEEDLFVITGTRPARRPRKRPRNIQKQLDVSKSRPLSCVFISLHWYWCWIE